MRKFILSFGLSLLLGHNPAALAQQDHEAQSPIAPDAGRLLRQIEDQHITRTLSDRMERLARTEPDTPYEVIDGGMPLPAGLCERHRAGCRSGEPR